MKPISILIPFKVVNDSGLMIWNQARKSDDELNSLMEFPGGKIEPNETPLDACVREVYEEVGIKLNKRNIDKFKTFSFNKGTGRLLIINVFIYHDTDSNFPSEGWLSWDTINKKQILPNNILIIKEFSTYYQDVIRVEKD
jgi:mutator protein MutT